MDVRKTALAAVDTIVVCCHEDTSATVLVRTLATQPLDLAIVTDLVVLEDGHLHFLVLVLELLGLSVRLLLALLATTEEAAEDGERRARLDAERGEGRVGGRAGQIARAGDEAQAGAGGGLDLAGSRRVDDRQAPVDAAEENLRRGHRGITRRASLGKIKQRCLTVRPKLKVARFSQGCGGSFPTKSPVSSGRKGIDRGGRRLFSCDEKVNEILCFNM